MVRNSVTALLCLLCLLLGWTACGYHIYGQIVGNMTQAVQVEK